MTDNELIALFLPIINTGLAANGFTDVVVLQSNQPTQQGIPTGPAVYFTKISNRRYGFLGTYDKWDSDNGTMVHTEVQPFESTYQVSALVLQNPKTPTQYTASDLVNEVAAILQSEKTVMTLASSNVGVLRISDIGNPYFVDDQDQFEANPSFDFTLTYRNVRVSTTAPITLPVQYNVQAI